MLDGKYEITSERELHPGETLFSATAPDGTALHIRWYDLSGAEDERAFERYRTLLRQLRRGDHVAVYDLVARPGAHYVVWHVPKAGAVATYDRAELAPIETLLAAHGRSLGEAHLCAEPGAPPRVYALAFRGAPAEAAPTTAPTPRTNAVEGLWTRFAGLWPFLRPWAVGGLLALVGALLLALSAERSLQSALVNVPVVRGADVNTALAELYDAGFSAMAVALTSSRPAGEVLEVSPPAGTPLRPGRTLSVSYALPAGRAPERVPAVTGAPLKEAEATLAEAGFSVGGTARIYSDAEVGTVVAQTPAADAFTAQGGTVRLLVSDGPRGTLTFLPDLTGLPLDDALSLAEAAGFARETVRRDGTAGNGVSAGTVLAQNIAPFVRIPLAGAQLRLTVAEGGATTAAGSGTPDLVGLSFEEALRRARLSGLGVTTGAVVNTPELPIGVVLQRPAPGAPAQGSVTVTLNEPPQAKSVRRARYTWQLEPDTGRRWATVTVRATDGTAETVVREQVRGGERVEGTYLSTAPGPLTFELTLDGEPYGAPLTVP